MRTHQQNPDGITLNINLSDTLNNEIYPMQHLRRQDLQQFANHLQRTANQAAGHFAIEFDLGRGHHIQILCVVHEANSTLIDDNSAREQVKAESGTYRGNLNIRGHKQTIDPKEVYVYVEQALRSFHSTSRLLRNPLIQLINLEPFEVDNRNRIQAPGTALRRLLDHVITAISDVQPDQELGISQWRLEHYLHLRYREGIQHKELASHFGYTERHLLRLRRELVLEAAELIISQSG